MMRLTSDAAKKVSMVSEYVHVIKHIVFGIKLQRISILALFEQYAFRFSSLTHVL